jgi:hypothetical protein
MRLANLTFPTRQFFERSATYPHQQATLIFIAPHAQTNRFTYTVPANRLALIHYAAVHVGRATAATTASNCGGFVYLTNPGGTVFRILHVEFIDNTLQNWRSQVISTNTIIPEGWSVKADTFDNSTGGTITYLISCGITEFSL